MNTKSRVDEIRHKTRMIDSDLDVLLERIDELEARLNILRRYHGNDETVAHEQVIKALGKE